MENLIFVILINNSEQSVFKGLFVSFDGGAVSAYGNNLDGPFLPEKICNSMADLKIDIGFSRNSSYFTTTLAQSRVYSSCLTTTLS